jgi:F-type H+-transporting ATPase subunit delta
MMTLTLTQDALSCASGYAKALFDISVSKNCLKETKASLEKLNAVLQITPSVAIPLMQAQRLTAEESLSIMAPLWEVLDAWTVKTLRLMITHQHTQGIVALYDAFMPYYEEANGIGHLYVQTAFHMDAELEYQLTTRLKKLFNLKEAVLHTTCEPNLIGGLYVEYKGMRFDATLKRKLKRLEEQLTQI